jgi:hypothetical protein
VADTDTGITKLRHLGPVGLQLKRLPKRHDEIGLA